MKNLTVAIVFFVSFAIQASQADCASPNILWFVVDDMSASFSCYGESTIQTPNVDKLAAEGTRFSHAYVTAPVCSPCRSALITGMYQTSIGAHQHRSGRGEIKIHLPEDVQPVPVLFQQAGYYSCIGSGLIDKDFRGNPYGDSNARGKAKGKKAAASSSTGSLGKTDYNFEWNASMYNGHDWSGRAADQPFFMQVQLPGGKLREGEPESRARFHKRVMEELGSAVESSTVTLPPYYPRDRVLLEDWAAYLDAVRMTDKHVGEVIARLEREGILEKTLVVFMTDHGISHARGKQFLYDEGTHVPFVVRGPGISKGVVRTDLIEHIDLTSLSLAAAGISIPLSMQGRDILAKEYAPREAVFAARDRCDETVERLRSVRTDDFLYIRNFYPQRPHLQPNAYKDGKAILQALRASHAAGMLPALSEKLLFSATRPSEELYEYRRDRWQINNLAENPAFQSQLVSLRARLDRWMQETQDRGPESEAMYDSDMADYVKKGNPEIERNIAQMKQWAREGK